MIDHNRIEAKLFRLAKRLQAGGAAIDRDQQLDAALGERADGIHIRPVALEDAIRNMDDRIEPAMAQKCASSADAVAPSTS